jgi:ferredoxin-NADP reductase
MKFKFISSEPVKGDVVSFLFEPDQPVSWHPGQYFHYVLPHPDADDRGVERWFTCSAAPSEGHVMISTRVRSDNLSSFKRTLQSMKPGDEIDVDGPEGDFTVKDLSRNYIFVAGGIGITPIRSILVESGSQGQQIKVDLLYANRNNEVPFSELLEELASNNPILKVNYIIDPQKIDLELLKKHIESVENPIVYISGPEPMVKSLSEQLAGIGLSKDNLKTDDFPGYETY